MDKNRQLLSEIKPFKKDDYDCLQNVIYTIAMNWNIEPTMLFSLLWGFQYYSCDSQHCTFGDKIDLEYENNCWKLLEKYNGIKLTKIIPKKQESFQEVRRFITNIISNNNQVALKVDVITCPWSQKYKKVSYPHYCIVCGFDNDNIICVDPDSSNSEYKVLPNKSLKRGYNYIMFQKEPVKYNLDLKELLNELCEVHNNYKTSFSESLNKLANDLIKIDNISKLGDMKSISNNTLVMKLEQHGNIRRNCSNYFNYLYDYFGNQDLAKKAYQFQEAYQNWYKTKIHLIKFCKTRNIKELERVSDKLKVIAKIEDNMLTEIQNFLK